MASCCSGFRCSRAGTLWSRSASSISTTATFGTMANSICARSGLPVFAVGKLDLVDLVTPSTMCATWSPNESPTSSLVAGVSSTASCRCAAACGRIQLHLDEHLGYFKRADNVRLAWRASVLYDARRRTSTPFESMRYLRQGVGLGLPEQASNRSPMECSSLGPGQGLEEGAPCLRREFRAPESSAGMACRTVAMLHYRPACVRRDWTGFDHPPMRSEERMRIVR